MLRFLSVWLCFFILVSPIMSLDNPSEMSTELIVSELSNNNLNIMKLSNESWLLLMTSKRESEKLSTELGLLKTELISSKELITNLKMDQSKQASLVTEMLDFSKSLNQDLLKARRNSEIKNWVIVGLAAGLAISLTVLIIK